MDCRIDMDGISLPPTPRRNRAGGLAGRGYLVTDEVGSTSTMGENLYRRESVSTRGYIHEREDPSTRRFEAIERSLALVLERMEGQRMASTTHGHSRQNGGDREAFVRDHLARENMEVPQYEGKLYTTDMFVKKLIPKPYMFIQKPSLSNMKKKLEYRGSVSAQEYVAAFVRMLSDHRARDPSILVHQIAHLRDVTQDIINFSWPSVREWSHCVFDSIERGDYFWTDVQDIQNDRFRLSYRGRSGQAHDSHTPAHGEGDDRLREAVCIDFNNRVCSHGGKGKSHVEGSVRLLHVCMYCLAMTGAKRDHPLYGLHDGCRSRPKDAAVIAAGGSSHSGYQYQQASYGGPSAAYSQPPRFRQSHVPSQITQQYAHQTTQHQQQPKN